MKILISGGAGFIGCHLARRLLSDGWTVSILDNFLPQVHGTNRELPGDLKSNVQLWIGDVRNSEDWKKALSGQKVVIHLAAETGTGQSMYEIARYEDVNIHGTALLMDEIARMPANSIERVVYASSRAVYGEGKYQCPEHGIVYPAGRSSNDLEQGKFEPACPVCQIPCTPLTTDEDTPGRPLSIYGFTKLAQEMMISLAARFLGFKACGLRYQNVYGPGQSLKNPYTGILSIFSGLAKRGEEINIFEDGHESRDFVYIEDVIEATVRSLTLDVQETEVLNVGSGRSISVLEVAGLINEHYGQHSKLRVSGEYRQGDIRHNFADLSRVRAKLGFQPAWIFKDGLKQFLDWVDLQEGDVSGYKQSLDEMKARGLMGKSS